MAYYQVLAVQILATIQTSRFIHNSKILKGQKLQNGSGTV